MTYCYKRFHDQKQSQTQTKLLNFITINSENQIVPGESINKDISFEWLHHRKTKKLKPSHTESIIVQPSFTLVLKLVNYKSG